MADPTLYGIGKRVRLLCSLPSAAAGAEGSIARLMCDDAGQVTAMDILIDSDATNIHGITAYPHEVTVLDSPLC